MLSKITSIIIIVLLIILIVLNCFHNKKANELNELKVKKTENLNNIPLNVDFMKDYENYKSNYLYDRAVDRQIIKDYDKSVLYDPFKAPRGRSENDVLFDLGVNNFFNISTHGALNDYHVIGTLLLIDEKPNIDNIGPFNQKEIKNNATIYNNVLQLFGREKYPRGRIYEYYTVITSGNQTLKIPIFNKNHQELYDGDKVFIRELNKYYVVSKYPNEEIEYIPN